MTKKEEVLTTKVNTKVLMTDNFFLNIKVLVAKVLKKKGTSDMIPFRATLLPIPKFRTVPVFCGVIWRLS